MEKVTFFESMIRILKYIASVPLLIEVLILTVLLLIVMLFFYFRKSSRGKKISLIIYGITLLLLPVSHISFFASFLDGLIENFIKIIYFPTIYIYLLMLIISDIGVLKSLIDNSKSQNESKKKAIIEGIHITYFFLFQFLFFLIVRLIIANDVDVFDSTSVYNVSLLVSAIQISSYLFWIRIGIKLFAFAVNKLSTDSLTKKSSEKKEDAELINSDTQPASISIPALLDPENEENLVLSQPITNQESDTSELRYMPIYEKENENLESLGVTNTNPESIDIPPMAVENPVNIPQIEPLENNDEDDNYFDDFYE